MKEKVLSRFCRNYATLFLKMILKIFHNLNFKICFASWNYRLNKYIAGLFRKVGRFEPCSLSFDLFYFVSQTCWLRREYRYQNGLWCSSYVNEASLDAENQVHRIPGKLEERPWSQIIHKNLLRSCDQGFTEFGTIWVAGQPRIQLCYCVSLILHRLTASHTLMIVLVIYSNNLNESTTESA